MSWEEGLAKAKESGTPICLVVYADWCPKCKQLAPVFRDPEVAKQAEKLVMILQDQDEKPAWLKERFGEIPSYVPRVFFLTPEGELRTDLTGPNTKYPYFYWPQVSDWLKTNMERVHRKAVPAGK
jgi:thiol:disulfide interchange protein